MKILMDIFFLCIAACAFAENNCIAVYDKNNEVNIMPINDASEIQFEDNIIRIGSYSFNMDMLSRYIFADKSELGIEDVMGDINGLKILPVGLIHLDGTLKNQEIGVWDTQGIVQNFVKKDNVVDIRHLPSNVYVIKIGNTSFKFVKK